MKRTIVLALAANFIVSAAEVAADYAYAPADLIVIDIRISPDPLGPEHNIFVTTFNSGDATLAPYNIRVVFMNGTSGNTGDIGPFSGIGEFNIGSFILSTSAQPGPVTLVATVDSSDNIVESNEFNNDRTEIFTLISDPSPWKLSTGANMDTLPDITLGGPVLDGVAIQVTVKVSNFGNLAISNDIEVLLTSDQGDIDTDAEPSDTKTITNSLVDPIVPGASKTVDFTWTPDFSQNVSKLRAIVDPNDFVAEADETNNLTILTLVADADNDGVNDDADLCPATVIPEGVPTTGALNPNHWALTDDDDLLDFDTVLKGKGKGPNRNYNTTDTAGCSCEQIIEMEELGDGHTKHGCSISAMDDWVDKVNMP